jgi:hypothetical protein
MVETGKGSPKVPGNSPLGAIDLDDVFIGTCKSKESGGRPVQLLRHCQIRHFISALENKAAKRSMID